VSERLLICSDLDGTLLPNGPAPESPEARELVARIIGRPEVSLAYVTGRDRALVEEAMVEFALPGPQFVIGDVGTTIYEVSETGWQTWRSWTEELAAEWGPGSRQQIEALLEGLSIIELQEDSRQSEFKVSYYVRGESSVAILQAEIRRRLEGQSVSSRQVYSRDSEGVGLLDLLPSKASKLSAIEFLLGRRGFQRTRTVYAGDSGNDLEVLASDIPSVLVANACEAVRQEAFETSKAKGNLECLYLARGGYLGMNGNYGAGILEGLAHFLPEAEAWLERPPAN
jgi:HAD superfamily hydrolase (TIGR01484 family)